MKVTLERYTADADGICGEAAAVCTGSTNPEKSLEHSLASGHESIMEHASFTFKIVGVSRVLLAQLTRHRIASFSVMSQRYVNQENCDIIIPKSIQGELREKAIALAEESRNLYKEMLNADINQEDARYILLQGCTTVLYVTMNGRELRHFFSLRCCNRAQWEIREMADKMLKLAKEAAPRIFQNAGTNCVSGKCTEKKPCGHPRNHIV